MNRSQENQNPTGMDSRRTFIKKAVTVGAAPLLLSPESLFASKSSPMSKHRWDIGTCDWTLKTPLTTDSFHQAQRCGIEGMQYSFNLKGEGLDLRFKKNRDTIRQTVKETGVGITSLGMAILNKVPYASAEESQQIVIDCIETMATLKKEADDMEDREFAAKISPHITLMVSLTKEISMDTRI